MTVPTIMRIRSARPVAVALSAAVIIVVSASATIAVPDSTSSQGGAGQWVEQIGTYDSLVSPDYDGLTPISAASSGATLGLGTFDQLDGEMVLVGGVIYRVGTDGIPVTVPSSRTTPFFEGIRFTPEVSGPVAPGTTCANLLAAVNALASSDSGIVAVRVRGTFTDLVTRSVPAQRPPYAPLAQIVAGQTVFQLGQRTAVLVGFRTAPDLAGTGAPGLHLHGLTADRSAGGHVLSCVAGSDVQLSVQRADGVRIRAA
jgi:acetolactate decarboxylase